MLTNDDQVGYVFSTSHINKLVFHLSFNISDMALHIMHVAMHTAPYLRPLIEGDSKVVPECVQQCDVTSNAYTLTKSLGGLRTSLSIGLNFRLIFSFETPKDLQGRQALGL